MLIKFFFLKLISSSRMNFNRFSFKVIQKDPVGVFTFDLKSKDYDYDPEEGG